MQTIYGDLKWVTNFEDLDILNIPEDSGIGYILEVDLEYPIELHYSHNDLSFCAQNILPSPTSKTQKLVTGLDNKTNYIIHYRVLQQCIQNRLKLKKILNELQFSQSPWLEQYIDLNKKHRLYTSNDFQKNLFKLMKNSVYG